MISRPRWQCFLNSIPAADGGHQPLLSNPNLLKGETVWLEAAIREGLSPEPLLAEAEKQLDQEVMLLIRNLPPPEALAGKRASRRQIADTLRLLERRLRGYDAGSLETLHELLRLTAHEPELRQKLAALQVLVEQFDFEAALTVFLKLPKELYY